MRAICSTRARIEGLIEHYRQLLEQMVSEPPGVAGGELRLLSEEQQSGRCARCVRPRRRCFKGVCRGCMSCLSSRCSGKPEALAVSLRRAAADVWAAERDGQSPGALSDRAGGRTGEPGWDLCGAQPVVLVISVLGVLKAGGCYVPMDPDYPVGRLGFMLADSGLEYLINEGLEAGDCSGRG